MKPSIYYVVCGNIGTVFSSADKKEALKEYDRYVALSKNTKSGKVSGEEIILFLDADVIAGYIPLITVDQTAQLLKRIDANWTTETDICDECRVWN